MTLGRWALIFAALFVGAVVVVGVFSELEVGLAEPPPVSDDFQQQLIDDAVAHEEWYLTYGRWIDLLTALAFTSLLVAAPFLADVARARHVIVAGAAVAALGDVIDLSQLIGIDIARISLDNDTLVDFTAGNVYRIAINTTSTDVWVAGLFLLAVGVLILAWDATSVAWTVASVAFAATLVAVGYTDLFHGGELAFDIAQYALAGTALVWIGVAMTQAPSTLDGAGADAGHGALPGR